MTPTPSQRRPARAQPDTEGVAASYRGSPSDAELISRVRGGDVDSYGELFARHRDAATRLARQLLPGPDSDDLVSDAFTKVLTVLLRGAGPDLLFRPYLLTAVRRLHVDKVRATRRTTPTDNMEAYDSGMPFADTVVSGFEGGAAARAFASLPERWQLVLWHLEVEGSKPADIAPLLGMSPNSVSALAYRAREGLRQSFLQMHAADITGEDCGWTHEKLGAYVRGGLSRRDTNKVEEHLEGCRRCTAIYLELIEVNSELGMLIGPLVLGGAATAYIAGSAGATTGAGGLMALLERAKDALLAHTQAVTVAGAAVCVAGVATIAVVAVNHSGPAPTAANEPRPSTITRIQPTAPPSPGDRAGSNARRVPLPVPVPRPRSTNDATPSITTSSAVSAGAPAETPAGSPANPQSTPPVSPPPTTTPPTIAPPPPPPPIPTLPPQPALPTADVAVHAVRLLPTTVVGLAGFTLRVDGIPAGRTVRLDIALHRARLLAIVGVGGLCSPANASSMSCTIPARSLLGNLIVFVVRVQGPGAGGTATVSTPEGFQDTDPGNNTVTLHFGAPGRHNAR